VSASAGLLIGPGVANADPDPDCSAGDRIYGITGGGTLVEHNICTSGEAEGSQTVRQIAEGWWLGGAAFYGGSKDGVTSFYQVSPDGNLLRFELDSDLHMGQGTIIGAEFGDWNRYRSLFAQGDGNILGVDPQGQLLRWSYWPGHEPEQWEGPTVLRSGLTGAEHLFGVKLGPMVLEWDPAAPRALTVSLGEDTYEAGHIPDWVDPRSIIIVRGGHTLYGLTAGGQIAQIRWEFSQADEPLPVRTLTSNGYVRVFGFESWSNARIRPWPYEWQ
jgi:hypothetical protein